jgi:hypothetical protein
MTLRRHLARVVMGTAGGFQRVIGQLCVGRYAVLVVSQHVT